MNKKNDFSIHVLSNTNNDFYKNSLTTFTNFLPNHHLLKKGKWLCGVAGFGVHLNINHLKIKNEVVGVYYLGGSLLEGFQNIHVVLSTDVLQLKFKYKEYVPQLLKFDFINFFDAIDPSKSLSKVISLSVNNLQEGKDQFVFSNTGFSDNYFLFHEKIIEALYAKNLITTKLTEEEQQFIKFKNKKVTIKNEKYFIIKLPSNTTLYGETFNSETFNFPALINIKCNITSKHPMNEEFSSIIHTSSIPFKFDNKYFYRHLSNIRYFEVTSSDLNSIKIKYQNLDGSPLNLLPGSASFVKLHFKPMNYLYQPLTHITLTSKNQLPYNFSSLLKHPIELDEDGAICLNDVSIPNQILNVPSALTKNSILFRIIETEDSENLQTENLNAQSLENNDDDDSEKIPNSLHEYVSEIDEAFIVSQLIENKNDSKREVSENRYGKFTIPKGHFFFCKSFLQRNK